MVTLAGGSACSSFDTSTFQVPSRRCFSPAKAGISALMTTNRETGKKLVRMTTPLVLHVTSNLLQMSVMAQMSSARSKRHAVYATPSVAEVRLAERLKDFLEDNSLRHNLPM